MSKEYLKDSPFPKEPKSGLFYNEKKNRGKRKYFAEDEVRRFMRLYQKVPGI